jgi:hypothetical protein
LHVVRLKSRSAARLPPYDEIAARVADEYAAQRRREANERAYRALRDRYRVVIELPANPAPPSAAPELPR